MSVDMMLTAGVLAVLGWLAVWKSVPDAGPFSFDKERTNYLKGFCALVVVLTHVPAAYGNPVQKAVHSFGFVAVTLFFLISAYGMSFGAERNPAHYLAHFWRNRLASLLVPWFLVRICGAVYAVGAGDCSGAGGFFRVLFRFPLYVSVLLEYCLLFYVVMQCRERGWLGARAALVVQVLVISLSSLLFYVFADSLPLRVAGWSCERMGLVWGVLLFHGFAPIASWMASHRRGKTAVAGMLAAGLGIAYLLFKPVWFWGGFLLRLILGLSILVFVFLAIQQRRLGNGATRWLGDVSYEVYLVHGLTQTVLVRYFPGLSSGWFVVSWLTLALVCGTGIHALSSRLVPRIRAAPVRQKQA